MLGSILKKLIYAILIFLGVSMLTFGLGRLAPGDGLDTYLRTDERLVSEEDMELARERLGMNDPVGKQYFDWMNKVLHGDFGISYRSKRPVLHDILLRLPNTLLLTALSLTLSLMISVPAAWFCTAKSGSTGDHLVRFLNTVVIAMPMFCIGLLVMLIFGVQLQWFPIVSGKGLVHYVMPTMTLGIGMSGRMIRYFRTQFLEICRKEHVMYAQAMGVRGIKLFRNHILRPLLPQLTVYLGLRFAGMLGGSYIIESMFSVNGSGSLLISSVSARDYPMIQGYAVMMAAFYVIVRFAAEAAAALMEPRLRRKYEAGT